MAERRAEPRRRRLHGGNSGQNFDIQFAPCRIAIVDRFQHRRRHCENARIAARHDSHVASARGETQRVFRARDLDAIVARKARLAGRDGNTRDIGRIADDILRGAQRLLRFRSEKARIARTEADDEELSAPFRFRHGRRPVAGTSTIAK